MQSNKYYIEGLSHCKTGKFEEALSCFNEALNIEPDHVGSLYNRGWAKMKLNRHKEAVSDYNEALTITPGDADIISNRAIALFFCGKKSLAMEDCEKAIELEPENDFRYASRAYFRSRLGNIEGAIADYKKALQLDPLNEVTENNLAFLEEKKASMPAKKRTSTEDPGIENINLANPYIDPQELEEKGNDADTAAHLDKAGNKAKAYWNVISGVFKTRDNFRDFTMYVGSMFNRRKESSIRK